MESTPYREKTTLPRAAADVSEFDCVTAFVAEATPSVSEFGNINPMPFLQLNSWIPLGRAGSKLAVRNAKNPELPDGSAMGPTQSQPKPKYHQSHSTGPRGRQASGIQPLEPLLLPKLRSFFADFPWSHCSRGPEAIHLGVLMRISVRSVRQGRWSQGDLP